MLLIVNLLIAFTQLISNYYNYGGESADFASMLRMAQSKSYVSDITEIPILLNVYSPVLFGVFYPFIKIFNLTTLNQVVLLGRIMTLVTVLLVAWLIIDFTRRNSSSHYHRFFLVFSLLWFFVLFPGDILAVKPDFLSVLFELSAFVLFYEYTFKDNSNSRLFYFSSIFSGLAIATKLNTIGIFVGIILYLIFARKIYKAAIYILVSLFPVVALYAVFYWQLGEKLVINLMASKQAISFMQFIDRIDLIVFPYLIFYILMFIGLSIIAKEDKQKGLLIFFCLFSSFVLGGFGQLKVGSYLNYFFGFFTLASIPVSIGLRSIFENAQSSLDISGISQSNFAVKSLKLFTLAIIGVQLFSALKFPLSIILNDLRNYPYQEVQEYVQKKYPGNYVYISNEALNLYFSDKTLVGPWVELTLQAAKSLDPYVPEIKHNLSKYRWSLAMTMGSGCESWQPSGIFLEETKHINRLEKKFKKICLFNSDR